MKAGLKASLLLSIACATAWTGWTTGTLLGGMSGYSELASAFGIAGLFAALSVLERLLAWAAPKLPGQRADRPPLH